MGSAPAIPVKKKKWTGLLLERNTLIKMEYSGVASLGKASTNNIFHLFADRDMPASIH
jgi:hypothetical protein